jgi:colicin import membrane protein
MFSRSDPGLPISAALHLGLLAALLISFARAPKFDDAMETIAVDVVSDSQINEISKGEKSAKLAPPALRAEKAQKTETRPQPPTHEAKRDVPAPPPQAKPNGEPNSDEAPLKAAQAAPIPPSRPKPVQTAAAQSEPDDAEVVKPKPPTRPKIETAKEEKPAPEKPKEKPRLKVDDISKLLDQKAKDSAAPKPKSGDESAPKSKFNAAAISSLLSHEAPQQRGSTANERVQLASLGAPTATGAHLTPSMEARIGQYIKDHYQPCWKSGLSLGQSTFAPIVRFHLTRDGSLEGAPQLMNQAAGTVEQARSAQAVQAVRRCSPMKIPAEFLPYYEQALHEVDIKFSDLD